MENPSATDSLIAATNGLGTHGGRPPDNVIAFDVLATLERLRSPSTPEFQPSNKKGRCEGNYVRMGDLSTKEQGDLDTNMGDGLSDTMEVLDDTLSSHPLERNVADTTGRNSFPVIPTFKDKLLGSTGITKGVAPLSDLDVDVREEDGSRFEALADDLDQNDTGADNTVLPHDQIDRMVHTDTRMRQHTESPTHPQVVEVLSSPDKTRNSDTTVISAGPDGGNTVAEKVASTGKVIAAKSSLNATKNVAVQVLEPCMHSGSKEIKGLILPNSLKGGSSKTILKAPGNNSIIKQLGPKQKKREDRGVSKQNLASGLSKLVEDLNNAEAREVASQGASPSTTVRDMTTNSGEWDWSQLNSLLPRNILDQIAAIPPPHCQFSPDSLGWRWNDNREFSTRSAYEYLMGSNITPMEAIWKRIWNLEILQRVCVFLWTTIHQCHLTNVERSRPFAIWLGQNLLGQQFQQIYTEGWSCRFAIFCWLLWKERCNTIFEPDRSHREDLLIRVNRLLDGCQHAFATTSRPQLPGTVTQRWSRPPPGWVKANVDVLVISTAGSTSLGVVFRNEDGTWLYGFAHNIGYCSVLFAKLWALHDCLSKAWVAALGRSSPREGLSLASPPVELALLVEEEKESSICERMISQDWSNANIVAYFNMQSDPGGS
ncbi:hypothetical protein V6N11_050458 [Hibiscus sabdariffa]|uniref:Uncharacterized protein n=2 Tax=Hibiscus sabdariffa TaxID=183260 RepID=A0ABR2T9Y3_9ROSI